MMDMTLLEENVRPFVAFKQHFCADTNFYIWPFKGVHKSVHKARINPLFKRNPRDVLGHQISTSSRMLLEVFSRSSAGSIQQQFVCMVLQAPSSVMPQ